MDNLFEEKFGSRLSIEGIAETPAKEETTVSEDTPMVAQEATAENVAEDNETNEVESLAGGDRIPCLPRNLHPCIRAIVEPYADGRKEPMALLSLAMLGTLGGNAQFLYRNNEVHHLGFEVFLVGEQSIGKSALVRLKHDLLSELIREDKETRLKLDEFADECLQAGESGKKPKNPHLGTRIMMPATTPAQFFQNLKDLKGKRAIILAPEVDSLNKSNNWSRDGGANERLMFDTEEGGQDTKSAGGTSACVPVAVNLAMNGTPMAMIRQNRHAEDGLVTRVAFCSFPPFMDEEAEEKARTPKNREALVQMQLKLLGQQEGDVIRIPQLKKQQLDWCLEKKMVAEASGNQSINTFRKRAAVMGFRAGCILYLLDENKITRKAMDFARWVSEYVLYYQVKYFGEKMNESIGANAEVMQAPVVMACRNMWMFVQIPDVFDYNLVKDFYQRAGKLASGYRSTVSRWMKNGWVERCGDGSFRKTEVGKDLCKASA